MVSAVEFERHVTAANIFCIIVAFLWEAKQSIGRSISFLLTIIDLEIVSRELLGLVDLTRVQAFYIYQSTEVVIVINDKNLVFATLQVMAPSLESLNDGWELLIVNLILNFCKDHFLRKKGK